MNTKTYETVSALVNTDLLQKVEKGINIRAISETGIDGYFQDLVRTKGHLSPIPLKLGTVNRYVERFVKGNADARR